MTGGGEREGRQATVRLIRPSGIPWRVAATDGSFCAALP